MWRKENIQAIPSKIENFIEKNDTNDNRNNDRQGIKQRNEKWARPRKAPGHHVESKCYVDDSLQ